MVPYRSEEFVWGIFAKLSNYDAFHVDIIYTCKHKAHTVYYVSYLSYVWYCSMFIEKNLLLNIVT